MRKGFIALAFLLYPCFGCTDSPTGPSWSAKGYLYVSVIASNTTGKIYYYGISEHQVTDSIELDGLPTKISVSPDGRTLHISPLQLIRNSPPALAEYLEIDLDTKAVKYRGPNSGIFITPDGKYLINLDQGLKIYSATTHALVYESGIQLKPDPYHWGIPQLAFDPAHPIFYIILEDNQIFAFDYLRMAPLKAFSVLPEDEPYPEIYDICVSRDGKKLFYTCCYPGSLRIYDLTQSRTIRSFPFKEESIPLLFEISPKGGDVWVVSLLAVLQIPEDPGYIELYRYSSVEDTIVAMLEDRGDPTDLVFSPDGSKAFLGELTWGIRVIDLEVNRLEEKIQLPYFRYPRSLATYLGYRGLLFPL